MDLLPLEVLNKIAKNRTLYVLAASSTVNVGWRGCFNKNWMWWQHYNADTAEYLEAAECRVEARFESPDSEDSTQTCFYKKAGYKEISITESLNRNGLTPNESSNKISENQTLYVLAASSTVSVGWRGSCNKNRMWWQHYNADTDEYLEAADGRVESEDSTPTCLYKRAWDKEISIKETLKIPEDCRVLSEAEVGVSGPHCNADTAEYLETAGFRVDPRFESPKSEDSTQTCLYKKAGNKKITIKESLNRNGLTPNESSNKISENQTLYVLAASSTVSVGWRGSCNKNWMWWQHYNADTAEYLEAAECRVEPKFESPESEDITPTCLYKRAGDKEISIKESL
ncbi:hypothetical protein J6590_083208 [Homalodisca vitripennis]|nr:hypothetical protein J6590_083208 [Homalodisca vitripennis]